MRSRCARLLLLGLLAGGAAGTSGCAGGDARTDAGAGAGTTGPALGAPPPTPAAPRETDMDRLERAVADRLSPELADDELVLQHVACPDWDGTVPAHVSCEGYVDGVVGRVEVALMAGAGDAVEFDAALEDGVVATSRLVTRLAEEGYRDVRCGDVPAYPARRGLEIVCRVARDGEVRHVVATVTDRRGAVEIADY